MNYFLIVKKVKGKLKVFPLSGQTFLDGSAVINSYSVACSTSTTREEGKLYRCNYLIRVGGSRKSYYRASYIHEVKIDDSFLSSLSENEKEILESNGFLVDSSYTTTAEDKSKKLADEEPIETLKEKEPTYLDSLIKECPKNPTPSKDGFYMSPGEWQLLMRNVKKHVNTMILGSSGTGKTSCVKLLCEKLGVDLHVFDMGSMIDPISSLLGVHRLEDGASIFDYAKFTRVIQTPCVILLDELSRAPQSAMNILFPCLDDRRSLSVEIACSRGEREIKIHPEVTFIATANVGTEYSGTNTMDRALVDRFFTMELGQIPTEKETEVLEYRCGIKKEESSLIVKIANNLRSLAKQDELSMCPSIRETLLVASLVSDGWSLSDSLQRVLLPMFEGSTKEGERGIVFKTITSY